MDNTFTVLISAAAGAAFGFIPQYLIENKKAKTEKMKYSLDKKISVGEKFYENSGLAITVFESTLRTFENVAVFTSDAAIAVFTAVQENYQKQAQAITSTTNTISAADIYFNISGVDDVNKWMKEYQLKIADFHERKEKNILTNPEEAINDIIGLLKKIISMIKADRETIKIAIHQLLN